MKKNSEIELAAKMAIIEIAAKNLLVENKRLHEENKSLKETIDRLQEHINEYRNS